MFTELIALLETPGSYVATWRNGEIHIEPMMIEDPVARTPPHREHQKQKPARRGDDRPQTCQ